MKELRLSKAQSFKDSLQALKRLRWRRISRLTSSMLNLNSAFNLGETNPEPKIVRKVLRSLPKRFHAKITAIKESKDIDQIC